jgi:DNA-binding response OmpR family regulator
MRILVVDDEEMLRRLIARRLELHDHEVTVAESASEAFLCLAQETFDVILCDVHLQGMDGPIFLNRLSGLDAARVVLMTGDPSFEGENVLYKPFTIEQLFATIDAALRRSRG